jgi:lipopolysaccharide/colanic/teichoic acid biosynthesis glycosyltransferase
MTRGELARPSPVTAEAASAVGETGDLASEDVHDHLAPNPVAAFAADPEEPVDGVVVDLVPLADVVDHHVFLAAGDGLLGATPVQRAIKRLVEIAVASTALVVLSPVIAGVALAVLVTSRGPVIHRQQRIGLNGRAFRLAKFRTMSRDAEGLRPGLQDSNEIAGPVFKLRDDPRTTPLGRFLRKYSIDELPQLVHVISGNMALVGPRPQLPEEVAAYGPWERQRLLVKPGVTCIWQVSGRSDLDFDTWVEMDIDYIRRWSLRLDFAILARTLGAVLSGRGAY